MARVEVLDATREWGAKAPIRASELHHERPPSRQLRGALAGSAPHRWSERVRSSDEAAFHAPTLRALTPSSLESFCKESENLQGGGQADTPWRRTDRAPNINLTCC